MTTLSKTLTALGVASALLALPRPSDAQTNWQTTTSFPQNAYQMGSTEAGGFLYVAGGFNGGSLSNVYYAYPALDGTVPIWSETTALPAADPGPGLAIYSGWAYAALASGAIWRAPVLAGGGLGDWIAEASVDPSTSYSAVLHAYQGHLYLFGRLGANPGNVLRIAAINADGSLGPWGAGSLPFAMFRPAVHFFEGRAYLAGGLGPSGMIVGFSYSAGVNADGSLTAWRQEANLPLPVWLHSTVLVNSNIFLFGGLTNTAATAQNSAIVMGTIETGGAISNWVAVDTMPDSFSTAPGAVFASANGHAYLIGGMNGSTQFSSQVWHKSLAPAVVLNHPPVAEPQSVSLDENTSLAITLTGSDPDGDALSYVIVSGPTNGTLTGTAPNLSYHPNTDYSGPDAFTFKVNDGQVDSAVALVSIAVHAVNLPPVANPQTVSVAANASVPITLTGSDPDGDSLSFVIVAGPTNGTLTGTAPNLSYQPAANYSGPDAFLFKVNDGQLDSAPALVSITVLPANTGPVAHISVSPLAHFPDVTNLVVISPNGSTATLVLDASQSSDADGNPLSYAWYVDQAQFASGPVTTNVFEVGSQTITLVVSDGQLTGSATVTVEIITPAEAVGFIMGLVQDSSLSLNKKKPLLASLRAAAASFQRGRMNAGVNQLFAFKAKVRAQVARQDRELARDLIASADEIIKAVAFSHRRPQ